MKYHPNGSVLFSTFTVEEGLLLLSNPLCHAIIKSCLAAAQSLYPVRISHLLVEATHVHLVLTVHNPEDVPAFMRHFKTESAHMINSLLGRKKRTLWCDGYDSPTVLTFAKAMMVIAYIYSNPAKDNLVRSIDEYPGFSSWQMFKSGNCTNVWKRLRRPQFLALTKDSHNLRGYTREAERLLAGSSELQTFKLEPNAWLEAFGITDPAEQHRINARVTERVRTLEKRAARTREREKKSVIGRERLTTQRFDLTYRPSRKGKRMWCLAERRAIRMAYIRMFKKLKKEARLILALWRQGDMTERYPPGLYPPSFPKLANALMLS
jgi:REP element-mobilizing transposase RayT